jgi:hypothetical protein
MNTKELKKIEMKNDGKDSDRFDTLLKKVVSVPKKDIQTPKDTRTPKAAKTK